MQGSEERSRFRERERNGIAVDDTDVRGCNRGLHSSSINHAFTQAHQGSSHIFDFANFATCPLHRPLCRLPVPGWVFYALSFSLILFCLRLLIIRILLWFVPVMAFQKLNKGLSHVWLMRKIGEFDF